MLGTDIKKKQNNLAVYWVNIKTVYKFCCYYLDLLEYKVGCPTCSIFG